MLFVNSPAEMRSLFKQTRHRKLDQDKYNTVKINIIMAVMTRIYEQAPSGTPEFIEEF